MATTNLVIRNVLKATQSYVDFASKPIAFVFKNFPIIITINGVNVFDIATVPTVGNRIKFETVSGYSNGSEWTIPTNYLGKFIDGDTYYVVFGYIDSNGYCMTTAGTCGADITLVVDASSVPSKLQGCKVDALPVRLDCNPTDVTTIFSLLGQNPGEIAVL